MSRVFLDTSYLKALLDVQDDFHQKAVVIWRRLEKQRVQFVITNFVLDESYTLIRKRCGLEVARILRSRLIEDWRSVKIIRVTIQDEADAWNWFQKDWSELSFTDCTSFSAMKRLDLSSTATFDDHFTRAGFTIVRSETGEVAP